MKIRIIKSKLSWQEDDVFRYVHADEFGPGGEFTACSIATPEEKCRETTEKLDCPLCLDELKRWKIAIKRLGL